MYCMLPLCYKARAATIPTDLSDIVVLHNDVDIGLPPFIQETTKSLKNMVYCYTYLGFYYLKCNANNLNFQ